MRLADYKDEKAIEVLANVIEPVGEIMDDEKVREILNSDKSKLSMASFILKTHQPAVIRTIAALHDKRVEEFHFTLLSLTKDLMDIIEDPDLKEVFFSQSQNLPETHSGSATGNTKGGRK